MMTMRSYTQRALTLMIFLEVAIWSLILYLPRYYGDIRTVLIIVSILGALNILRIAKRLR
jgi:hypothetical protein